MRKRTFQALMLAIIFTLCTAVPSLAASSSRVGVDTFEEILNDIETYHISNPDSADLIRAAIDGMIESLNDSHTQYLSADELKDFTEIIEANYIGIGVQMEKGPQFPQVAKVFEDSPAWKAGIRPGDLITKVDGVDTSQASLEQIVQQIRGEYGTAVELTIRREGSGEFGVKVTRANIIVPTVRSEMLDNGIGYIGIDIFGTTTPEELRTRLGGLLLEGAHKLILDLRDNPGGLLDSVAAVTSNFVEPGTSVVSLMNRDGERSNYLTEGTPIAQEIPMIVLVNNNSASAAEILAGDLQDFGRARLVGSRTYGKGTAKITLPLKTGGALVVTTAKFYTPKGRFIDGIGLAPDLQVLTLELVMIAARRQLNPSPAASIIFETSQKEALVDGMPIPLSQPVMQQVRTPYLPLRFTFEALGYQVFWEPAEQAIKIAGVDSENFFSLGQGTLTVGGQTFYPSEPVVSVNGESYVPLSDFNLMGIDVKVDGPKIALGKKWQ